MFCSVDLLPPCSCCLSVVPPSSALEFDLRESGSMVALESQRWEPHAREANSPCVNGHSCRPRTSPRLHSHASIVIHVYLLIRAPHCPVGHWCLFRPHSRGGYSVALLASQGICGLELGLEAP